MEPSMTHRLACTAICLFFITGLVARAKAAPPDYSPLVKKYSALIQEEMQKNNVVGLSVALVDKNGVLWSQGFGSADVQQNVKATPATLYCIGSITKLFTATTIMQLHSEGLLDIDKPLATYLPDFRPKSTFHAAAPVTLRNVMTHHGGIPGDVMACSSESEDFRALLKYARGVYLTNPPDHFEAYSNFGYCLLGNVIEAASKQRYEPCVAEHIFKPLSMGQSYISPFPRKTAPTSRTYDHSKAEKPEGFLAVIPAGAIYSSVEDAAKFIQMWLNDGKYQGTQVLPATAVREMCRVQNENVSLDLGKKRGLGWEIGSSDTGPIYSHGGATLYYRALLAFSPENGVGAVMLSNSASGGSITWRTVELVKEAARIRSGKRDDSKPEPPRPVKHEVLEKNQISGLYATEFVHFKVEAKDDGVHASIRGSELRFVPTGNGELKGQIKRGENYSELPNETYHFWKVNGQDLMIKEQWNAKNIAGVKISPPPLTKAWNERVGKYRALAASKDNWFNEAELAIQDGIPILTPNMVNIGQRPPFHLRIVNDAIATVYGLGRYGGNVLECTVDPQGKPVLSFMSVKMAKAE
jgi:CubicO group peptidase (beta-lactamase class C family)